jgi:hypothetical protein
LKTKCEKDLDAIKYSVHLLNVNKQ